jgi:hypothetical protein
VKRFFIILTLCAGCWFVAGAQNSFTDQLQKSRPGEGKVTVTQDKSIEALVNTPPAPAATPRSNSPADKSGQTATTPPKEQTTTAETILTPDTIDTDIHKKVMRNGHKVNGFRVQVFAGGNSRNDRIKAERTGEEIKTLFPTEPVYVHFYSPRWICRMGNYRTYEEAHEMLSRVKQLGYQSAIVVKGKITVQYP